MIKGELMVSNSCTIKNFKFTKNDLLIIEYLIQNETNFIFEQEIEEPNYSQEETGELYIEEDHRESICSEPSHLEIRVAGKSTNNYRKSHTNERCGIRNIGNTCYMNAVLQCLAHTQNLADYFLTEMFYNQINKYNKDGSKGIVAELFYLFLK